MWWWIMQLPLCNLVPGQPFHQCEVGLTPTPRSYCIWELLAKWPMGLSAVFHCTVFNCILQARGSDDCFKSQAPSLSISRHTFNRNDAVDFSALTALRCGLACSSANSYSLQASRASNSLNFLDVHCFWWNETYVRAIVVKRPWCISEVTLGNQCWSHHTSSLEIQHHKFIARFSNLINSGPTHFRHRLK